MLVYIIIKDHAKSYHQELIENYLQKKVIAQL